MASKNVMSVLCDKALGAIGSLLLSDHVGDVILVSHRALVDEFMRRMNDYAKSYEILPFHGEFHSFQQHEQEKKDYFKFDQNYF